MKEQIVSLKNELVSQIISASGVKELENLESAYLGRNGKLTILIKDLKNVSESERKEIGILINDTKQTILSLFAEQKSKFISSKNTWFDPTIPGIRPNIGTKHLVTQAIDDIATIFEKIGFVRSRYPEVEWDWFAFESLNMPKNHPARDEWETFFVDAPLNEKFGKMVLTPHTSNGQVREMQRLGKPPIRMVNIAKTYRRQSDTTHCQMFHQFEGLVIDENINISHLKGTIDYFAKEFFGEGSVSRIRPFHFQFTEPSFEVDFSCIHCDGKGCKFCKSGWHEVGGAGMVHPNVLRAGGIDPDKYSGFAFGWGVERVRLLRSGTTLDDIRDLYTTDLRLLRQF
ncbi:MAG: phenylalanine--tRNA ligase subunit alpha [Patescibacteria group bacterium]